MRLETIKIATDYGRGWAIINADDFDPVKHVLFGAEAAAAAVLKPKADEIAIPPDWRDMHWKHQVALAIAIIGGDGPLVPAEGQSQAEKARAIIASEEEGR